VLLAAPDRLIVLEREAKLFRVTVADEVDWRVNVLLRVIVTECVALLDREITRLRVLAGDEVEFILVDGLSPVDGLGTRPDAVRVGLRVAPGESAIPAEYTSGIPEL
jgi:hypothetical protein